MRAFFRGISLIAVLCAAPAMAAEVFEGTFTASPEFGGGREREYRLVLEIESEPDGKLSGKIMSPNSVRCPKEDLAQGQLRKTGVILFRAQNQPELKGCGRLNFKGTRDGDQLVGTTFFEGKDRNITLKKK